MSFSEERKDVEDEGHGYSVIMKTNVNVGRGKDSCENMSSFTPQNSKGLGYGPRNDKKNFNMKKVCVKAVQNNLSEVLNTQRSTNKCTLIIFFPDIIYYNLLQHVLIH
jgi:hypothetical protein